jgi:hypothetical protein
MLKYRQGRPIFRNELSRLIQVRETFNVNAFGSNDLGKGCCQVCIHDTEKHAELGQRRLDRRPGLKLSSAARGTFLVRRYHLKDLPFDRGKNV